jgi:hypothetical protein
MHRAQGLFQHHSKTETFLWSALAVCISLPNSKIWYLLTWYNSRVRASGSCGRNLWLVHIAGAVGGSLKLTFNKISSSSPSNSICSNVRIFWLLTLLRLWGFYRGVVEDTVLLAYDAASLDILLPTFRKKVLSSSLVESSDGKFFSEL